MKKLLITGVLAVIACMPIGFASASADSPTIAAAHNINVYADGFVDSPSNQVGRLVIGAHVTASCYQQGKVLSSDTIRVIRAGEFTGYAAVRFYDSNGSVSSAFTMTPTELKNALPAC